MGDGMDTGTRSERTWAMVAHMSALCLYLGLVLTNLLFPYLIWRWKRKHSIYIAMHSLAALNFQITTTLIGLIALLIALAIPIIWLAVIAILTANIIYVGRAADCARDGRMCKYPFAIRWIRSTRSG